MFNIPPDFYSTGDSYQGVSYFVPENPLVLPNWSQTLAPQDLLLPLRYGGFLNQNQFTFQSQAPAFYNILDIKPINIQAFTEPTFSCSFHKMNQNFEIPNQEYPSSLTKNHDSKNTMNLLRYEEIKVAKLTQKLEEDLEGILNSILDHNGKKPLKEVQKDLADLVHSEALSQIYRQILLKYQRSAKAKEDTVRFVLRKAFTWIRDEVRATENLSAKAASLVLCNRYFKSKIKDFGAPLNDDELVNFLLPYKKNSRNKTANTAFATEIFASEEFSKDYAKFLGNIQKVLETENTQRKGKFLDFLLECAKKGDFEKIQAYKRLPWSENWIESIKIVAFELIKKNSLKTAKKIKRA
jgi:hypothetical protein